MDKYFEDALSIYRNANHNIDWYARIQWRIFPFQKIDNFVLPDDNILDIGCGYGLLANYLLLKSEKRTATGIDFSNKRIKIANTTVGKRSNLRFFECDIWKFEFEEYSTMIMTNFLHHISYESQLQLLEKCRKYLRLGGRLIIKEIDRRPLIKYFLSYVFAEKLLYPFDRIYYWNIEDLKARLIDIGFKVKVIPMHNIFPHCLIVCEK